MTEPHPTTLPLQSSDDRFPEPEGYVVNSFPAYPPASLAASAEPARSSSDARVQRWRTLVPVATIGVLLVIMVGQQWWWWLVPLAGVVVFLFLPLGERGRSRGEGTTH